MLEKFELCGNVPLPSRGDDRADVRFITDGLTLDSYITPIHSDPAQFESAEFTSPLSIAFGRFYSGTAFVQST